MPTPREEPVPVAVLREAVVSDLRARLERSGNPIADDPVLTEQTLAHARRVLAVALLLPDDEAPRDEAPGDEMGASIGVARALGGVDPVHSIDVSHMLLESFLAQCADQGGLIERVSALHRAMTQAVASAASTYVGALLVELREAHVAERRRISRELHDELAHTLGVALVVLEDGSSTVDERLTVACSALRTAVDEVRVVAGELRRTCEIGDLAAALRQWSETTGVAGRVTVTTTGDPCAVPSTYREELYFAAREAMRNSLARPDTAVQVTLEVTPTAATLEIADDGPGIPERPEIAEGHGIGFASMQERVALLRGRTAVTTSPAGTRIVMDVPFVVAR